MRILISLLFAGVSAFAQNLRIYHIDVDQAAATLFVSPTGKSLLVDSGKNGHGGRLRAAMQQAGVAQIDHFVCTHYHEDHYGGIDELVGQGNSVVQSFDRGDKSFLPVSKTIGDSSYVRYQRTVGENATHLMRGESIPFDPQVSVRCISSGGAVLGETNPESGVDENDMSISLLVQFQGFKYFIGGDIEGPTEMKIAERDLVMDVDMYHANHHGSNTSSTSDFMLDLTPSVIVISNGNHGIYRHPRKSVLDFYRRMNPRPLVLQTNKYLQGGLGGNVGEDSIADLESSDADGTILLSVSPSATSYTVSYRNKSHSIPVKHPSPPTTRIVIDSLLPDPVGSDADLEVVTLRNRGTTDASMAGWFLQDRSGRIWTLVSLGTIQVGQSATIRRNGMPMNLNNDGDEIKLFSPDNQLADQFSYANTQEGVMIATGH